MKKSFLALLLVIESASLALGNGGAWQEGIPGTGGLPQIRFTSEATAFAPEPSRLRLSTKALPCSN
jgi:hypothetical protein